MTTLAETFDRLRVRPPTALRSFAWQVVRWRYIALAITAAAWTVPTFLRVTRPHVIAGDYYTFVYGGRILIGSGMPDYHHPILHLYDQVPWLQIGPGPLLLVGALSLLPGNSGLAIWYALVMICGLVSIRAIELILRSIGIKRERAAMATLGGGLGVISCWAAIADWFHLEDAVAITCTLLAVAAIARGRSWWIPALLLGFGASCKPWALMSIALLLALPQRDRWRAGAVVVVTAGIWWVPFVAAAPHTILAVGAIPNRIYPNSAFHGLGFPTGADAISGARVMEVLFASAMAASAVTRGRMYGAPLAAFAARLIIEPRWFSYYGAGLVAAAVLWELTCRRAIPMWTPLIIIVEWPVQLWAPAQVGASLHVALLFALIVAVMLRQPRAGLSPATVVSEPGHDRPALV